MSGLRKREWAQPLAFWILAAFLGLLGPLPLGGRPPAEANPAPAPGEGTRSLIFWGFINRAGRGSPDLAERLSNAFRATVGQEGSLHLVPLVPTSPVVRKAIEEGLLKPEEIAQPPADLPAALRIAEALGVGTFLWDAAITGYELSPDQTALTLTVQFVEHQFVAPGQTRPNLYAFSVEAVARPGQKPTLADLEEEALHKAANEALAQLLGRPTVRAPRVAPRPKKQNLLSWVAGIAAVALLVSLVRRKGGPAGLAPTNVRTQPTRSGVLVLWNPVGSARASGYNLYRRAVGSRPLTRQVGQFQWIARVEGGDTGQYLDSSAELGVIYSYQVQAIGLDGTLGPRVPEEGTAPTGTAMPSRPTVQVEAGDGFVRLIWTPVPEDFISGYRIYRGSSPTTLALLATVPPTQTSYVDTSVTNGVTYYYSVVAFVEFQSSSRQILEGESSTVVSATPGERPPVAPRNLRAQPGDREVLLTWEANVEPDIDHYNIYRAQSAGRSLLRPQGRPDLFGRWGQPAPLPALRQAGFVKVGEAPAVPSPSFRDTTVQNNVTYVYYVTAVDRANQEGPPSNQVTVTPNAPPPAPQGLQARAGDRQVSLSWLPIVTEPDLAGYNVYRSTTPIPPESSPRDVPGVLRLNPTLLPTTQTQYLDTGLVNNTAYYYAVTAVDSFGAESKFSLSVVATPHVAPNQMTLTAQPSVISGNGISTSTITALLTTSAGQPVGGVEVTFTTSTGTLFPATAPPTATAPGSTTLRVLSDPQGRATVLLRSQRVDAGTVTATVTATSTEIVGPQQSATVLVQMRASTPAAMVVSAAQPQLPADTLSTTQVTASVSDSLGNPVPDGTEVEFSLADATQGALAPGAAAPPAGQIVVRTTTTNGVATATYRAGGRVGTVIITARAVGTQVAASTSIRLVSGPPAQLRNLRAVPPVLPADGSSTSTITVEVTDEQGNPVPDGTVVTFSTTLGSIGTTATTTAGVAQTTLTAGLEVGTAIVVASVGGFSAQVQVQFIPGAPGTITLSTIPPDLAATGLPADGQSEATIVATVRDAGGNIVQRGTVVTFATTLGSITPSDATDLNGQARATLRSARQAGTAVITVSANGASATLSVEFKAGPPARITLQSPVDSIPADGASQVTLQATVEDANGNPVADGTAVLFQVVSGDARITPTAATRGGVASAVLTAGTALGVLRIRGTVLRDGQPTLVTHEITIRQTTPVPASIAVVAEPTTISVSDAQGNSLNAPALPNETTIRATARDVNNRTLAGVPITFSSTDGNALFIPQNAPTATVTTDAQGVATVRLRSSTKAQTITVSASSATVAGSTQVTFLPGPPAQVTLSANPEIISANGTSTSTLTAEVKDAVGNPVVDGVMVVFSTTAGSISGPAPTVQGIATATLTSSTQPGTAQVRAAVGNVQSNIKQVQFSAIVPERIQVQVQPSVLVGDGVSTAIITATVTNAQGIAVPDGTVVLFETRALGGGQGPGRILNPTPTVNGRATATLQSTIVAQTVSFDVVARVGTAQGSARVTFTGGPGLLTLIATPATLPADGVSTATITATVTDASGNPVPDGTPVIFSTDRGTISPASATTVNGQANAVLVSSPQAGVATVSASSGSLQQQVQVRFLPGPPNTVTLTANPPGSQVADGNAAFVIVATVRDAVGNPVDPGTAVTFTVSPFGTLNPATATTDANGQAQTSLTSTQAGLVTVRATSGAATSAGLQVRFIPGPASQVTLTALPTSIPADGTSSSLLRATVADLNGNPVADGTEVTFTVQGGGRIDTDLRTAGDQNIALTANGVATATLFSSNQAATVTVRATVVATGAFGETTVVFTPRANLNIKLSASPLSIQIGTGQTATITATVADATTNAPVADGTLVTFTTTLGQVTPSAPTVNGVATATLTPGTTAGAATVVASTTGAAPKSVVVQFLPGPPSNISLEVSPSTIVADGSSSAAITATVQDLNGNVVPGALVNFTSSLANTSINGQPPGSVVTVTTDTNGRAQVTITGTTTGTTLVTATVQGTNVSGTVSLTLLPGPPTTVTLTANPTAIRANGISTSIIRATVQDANGNPVANNTLVTFSTTAGTIDTDPTLPGNQTDARTSNGVALATLRSSTVANTIATITATVPATGATGTVTVAFTPGPPASISLTANPQALRVVVGGQAQSATITATVLDDTNQPVANGTQVTFATNNGTIDADLTQPGNQPNTVTTNGIAIARLTSGTLAGVATVTATSGGVSASIDVTFIPGPPAQITIIANPVNILADGKSTSTITVTVQDENGNNVADGTVVTLSTAGGRMPTTPPDPPDLDPNIPGYQTTTRNGVAIATLTSSLQAGRYLVFATSGTVGASTEVVFSGEVPAQISIGFEPPVLYTPSIWANNSATIGVTCLVTDRNGNPVADGTPIRFRILDAGTNLPDGSISPAMAFTANGRATATVRSSTNPGLHFVEAVVYDANGNPVIKGTRELFFSGAPYRITLDTAGQAADPFRSANDFLQGELFQHNQFRHTDIDSQGNRYPFQFDNWYINQDPRDFRSTRVDYRTQVLDQNLNPVPDGTTVFYEVIGGGPPSLTVTSAPTQNGWTSPPRSGSAAWYTGYVSGGTNRSTTTLRTYVVEGLPSPAILRTYQIIHIHDPNDGIQIP